MSNNKQGKGAQLPETEVKGTIRDFILPIVEFLGILVPGVIFIFSFVPAVIIPLATLLSIVERPTANVPLLSEVFLVHIISPSFGTIFILSVFSYVVGHLFFRQDPKIPDEYSFKRVKETIKEEGPVRLGDKEREYNKNNKLPNGYNLEFPYRYLKEYLQERGMVHLAEMIPWSGNDPDSYSYRTKHFINVLKVRLEFLFPYQYLRIQRNEAHVRLMSSMWYAAKSIIWATSIGIILGAVSVTVSMLIYKSAWPVPNGISILLPTVVLILAISLKRHIESFLHYQRIREIVFILEAAYFAKKVYPEFDFIEQDDMEQNKSDKEVGVKKLKGSE